ncbi:MAG: hypothetical protein KC800_14715, partial [Candidatus Eremiobacteraeota bacterium]|nr:hypothetical protein [Candidatus Eremiobacteraeota bacterium]
IPLLRFPLDHIFFSSHFRLAQLKVMPYIGSDHFPILANLSLEDSAPVFQPPPPPPPRTKGGKERDQEGGIEKEKGGKNEKEKGIIGPPSERTIEEGFEEEKAEKSEE